MYQGEQRCPFAATLSDPDYTIDNVHGGLRVRARMIGQVKNCGLPYSASVCKDFGIDECQIFFHWYQLAEESAQSAQLAHLFASTLAMDCMDAELASSEEDDHVYLS